METEEHKTIMNDAEMQEYWKTLSSFTGENISAEIDLLMTKIRYPRFLYRYRPINNNNLDALRTNKLFFSQASNYDDPFDTFLHIDVEKLQQEFESPYNSPKTLEALANVFNGLKETLQSCPSISQELLQQATTIEGIKQLLGNGMQNQFLAYMLTLRSRIQEKILSICFSENGFNETLWLKYADRHRGFCLMYDLYDEESLHCGVKYGTPIYPVYYSNKAHDATDLAKLVMKQDVAERLGGSLPEFMRKDIKPLPWEIERNSLIKKECHKYDEEWRMIANRRIKLPAMIEWVPSGVIIGLRTSQVDANLIISMAKEAGIKKIYKSCINAQNKLDAFLLEI